jgi:penicillin-binding protein 1A
VDRVQDRWGKTVYRHDQRQCEDCGAAEIAPGEGPRIVSNRERVMDAITAYQLTSMLEGVVQRGSGKGVNLPVPVAGKTGTTNDAKDVWFIGYTSNIVAGCYMGFDQPRSLGSHAYGGTLCVPVFNAFMQEAVKEYGGSKFKVPEGGYWVKMNRFTGERLSDDAVGDFVVTEYLREGQGDMFGFGMMVDGGFGMGQNLPLFAQGESDNGSTSITTSTGQQRVIPKKADFGTLSAGGLY